MRLKEKTESWKQEMSGLKTSQFRKKREEENLRHQMGSLRIFPTRIEREKPICNEGKEGKLTRVYRLKVGRGSWQDGPLK